MKRFVLFVLLSFTLFSVTACNDFLDVNDDPNNASPEDLQGEPGLIFIAAHAQLSSNKNIEIIGQNSFAQTWSSGNGAAVFNNPELYSISTFTTGNTWDQMYTGVAENLQQIINITEEADPELVAFNPGNVGAQAKILQAYTYFHMTQMFEDIPFSQANNAQEFPNPAPDSQEEVLQGIIAQMDEAIAQADPSAGGAIGSRDVFFNGDMGQWVRFANTIKLRALFLLDGGGVNVDSQISDLLDNGQLIRDNADNALFPYSANNGNENNFFQLSQDFSGDFNGDGAPDNIWYVCGSTLVDFMLDSNDPRLSTYCEPNADGNFVGGGPGEFNSVPALGGTASGVSTAIHRANYPERFATAAEVWLLEAEWRARQGNLAAAQTALETGIAQSIDFFDAQPGAIDEQDKDDFIASLPDLTSLTNAEAVEYIQTQQWIDLFERHPENWTHWRRTKTPALEPPTNAQLEVIIRRYEYPPGPASTNPSLPATKQLNTPMFFEGAN